MLGRSIPASDEEGLHLAAQSAIHIARYAEKGDETHDRFDMIDDELSLARRKVYGTVEECRSDPAAELAKYQPLVIERVA